MEVRWEDMPPAVRAWYLELEEKQRQKEAAALALEQERGEWVVKLNPMARPPLTRPDGSVVNFDPVVYDEPDTDLDRQWSKTLKKLGGLE